MLLAGWEVRIGKNCDRGLENAARGRRPRAACIFKPEVTCLSFFFLPAVNWLTTGFVYATLLLNWLKRRLQTIRKKIKRTNKRETQKLDKE